MSTVNWNDKVCDSQPNKSEVIKLLNESSDSGGGGGGGGGKITEVQDYEKDEINSGIGVKQNE